MKKYFVLFLCFVLFCFVLNTAEARARAGLSKPLAVLHTTSTYRATAAAAIEAGLLVLYLYCRFTAACTRLRMRLRAVPACNTSACTRMRMRRLTGRPAWGRVVPVRLGLTILEPPTVVLVVKVLDQQTILVAGGEAAGVIRILVEAVVVMSAATRAV